MKHPRTRTRIQTACTFATAALAALGLTMASAPAQSAITWSSVADIVDETDVATLGEPCIAVNLGPEPCETVINGVHFQADRGHWAPKVLVSGAAPTNSIMYWPDFTSGGFTLSMPWERANTVGNGLTPGAAYNFGLSSAKHIRPGNWARVNTVSGLTPGRTYLIQLWCAHSNNLSNPRLIEWDNGVGGREGAGGIFMTTANATRGQVATGSFVASASGIQTFTCHDQDADPSTTPPLQATWGLLNMFQIREVFSPPGTARATYYGEGTPGTQRGGRFGIYGGTNCSPAINLSAHPVLGSTVTLTAENSSGAPSSALIVLGLAPIALPVLSGVLLVTPDVLLPVPMPFPILPGQSYVQTHELQLPLMIPLTRGTAYVQVLQLDAGAAEGVSFTPAIKIDIGS